MILQEVLRHARRLACLRQHRSIHRHRTKMVVLPLHYLLHSPALHQRCYGPQILPPLLRPHHFRPMFHSPHSSHSPNCLTNTSRCLRLSSLTTSSRYCDTRPSPSCARYTPCSRPTLARDFVGMLPPELASYILQFVPPAALFSAAKVSHSWRTLIDLDPTICSSG